MALTSSCSINLFCDSEILHCNGSDLRNILRLYWIWGLGWPISLHLCKLIPFTVLWSREYYRVPTRPGKSGKSHCTRGKILELWFLIKNPGNDMKPGKKRRPQIFSAVYLRAGAKQLPLNFSNRLEREVLLRVIIEKIIFIETSLENFTQRNLQVILKHWKITGNLLE